MFPENVWATILTHTDSGTFAALAATCQMMQRLSQDAFIMAQRCRQLALPHGLYVCLASRHTECWCNGQQQGLAFCEDASCLAMWRWHRDARHGLEELRFRDGRRWGQAWRRGQRHGLEYHLAANGRPLLMQRWQHDKRDGSRWCWNADTFELESYSEWCGDAQNGLEQLYERGRLAEQASWLGGVHTGTSASWWPSGRLRTVRSFSSSGALHGQTLEFFASGAIRLSINYVDGQEHGVEQQFFSTGQLRLSRTWESGHLSGPHLQWDADGRLREESLWAAGRPVGVHHSWHEQVHGGCLSRLTPHAGGVRHGTERRWYRHGSLAQVTHWVNGARHGIEMQFYPDGKSWHSTSWVDGSKDGIEQEWINGVTVSISSWQDGLLHGQASTFLHTGDALSMQGWSYGLEHGKWREWWPNGQLKRIERWNDGQRHGYSTRYYDDGIMQKKTLWLNGVKCGTQRRWHPNGTLGRIERWQTGMRAGYQLTWSAEGALELLLPFVGGQLHGIGWESSEALLYFWGGEEVTREVFVQLLCRQSAFNPHTGELLVLVRPLLPEELGCRAAPEPAEETEIFQLYSALVPPLQAPIEML